MLYCYHKCHDYYHGCSSSSLLDQENGRGDYRSGQ